MRRAAAAALALACCGAWAAVDPPALSAARAAAGRRDWAAALPAYAAFAEAEPVNADLLIEAARVHGFADRNAEAAALYRRALAAAPARRADVLPSLAWQTLWGGDAATASTLFTELTVSGRDRADAFDGLGQAQQAANDLTAAAAAFRSAVALRPDDAALRRRLARVLLWRDQPEAAAAELESIQPRDHDTAWALATAYSFADRHRAALAAFQAAGEPRNDGERFDLARTWAWAGFEDRAVPLLAGQTETEAAWLRDWRAARETRPYAYAGVDHAVDRDSLESLAFTFGAGLRPRPGQSFELRGRHARFTDAAGAPRANELQALYRWRLGGPLERFGTLWPTLVLRAANVGGWTPFTGLGRITWLPDDGWRVDAEAARETVDTPTAIAQHVTVDALSIGADHRFGTRLGVSASVALLRFDDGNRRTRFNGRLEYALGLKPRWTAGIEATAFESSDAVSGRGYWNPRRYDEQRVFTTLRWEQRPWDVYGRIALGLSKETGFGGDSTRGHPRQWEIGVGWDLATQLRATLTLASSSNGGFGFSGGAGYWRRTASLGLLAWF
jgi:thioredoxin-like negative regulator of GroEL